MTQTTPKESEQHPLWQRLYACSRQLTLQGSTGTLQSRRAAEVRYSKAYSDLVRAGLAMKLKGKYRA